MSGQALVHRSHHELPEHLTEALATYCAAQGQMPSRITVHPSQVAAARAALSAGAKIAVEGLGGCLTNEIWLWLPSDEEEEDV
jgi:hypothetical protein